MKPAELRRALPRAYYAFYGRHGSPRKIQLESARPILSGRDALLLAPAATGKTEAFSAPLFERLLAERWLAPAILIVSPTRALANDLCRRLREPADALGVPLGRWTGERKEPEAGALPAVTILTPESLDARISRSPGALRSVRALVLDELHVLDGNPRGDQLRILVSRLRRIAPGLQVVAASATVADPEGLARRYLRDPAVLRDPARLRILAKIVPGCSPKIIAREIQGLARAGARKFLLFANSRDAVERYAAALQGFPPFEGRVYAHHGSLSKHSRESAEEAFLAAPRAVCVATMTLELGIDIGDVDVAGLLEPPADVAGLLQRIGRSGRRGQGPKALLFARDSSHAFRYRTLLGLAREGDLAADPAIFHPSVLVQQALSLLHENPGLWISASAFRRRLDRGLASEWTEERLERILSHLAEEGWLEDAGGGRYVEGPEAEEKWRRGVLHSNLSDPRELEVIDGLTGEKIAEIAAPSEGAGGKMQIAGRHRRVVWEDERRIVVSEADGGETPRFAPRGVAAVGLRLAQAHARRLGIPEDSWPVLVAGPSTVCVFHFLGTVAGEVLAAFFSAEAGPLTWRRVVPGPFAVVLCGLDRVAAALFPASSSPIVCSGVSAVEEACRTRMRRLVKLLGMGPYHRLLPPEEAERAVFRAVDAEALAERFQQAEMCRPPSGVSRSLLLGLAGLGGDRSGREAEESRL